MNKRTPERQIPMFEATPLSYYCKLLPAEQSVTVALKTGAIKMNLENYYIGAGIVTIILGVLGIWGKEAGCGFILAIIGLGLLAMGLPA